MIEWPSGAELLGNYCSQVVLTKGGGLGLANLSCHSLQMWERKVCSESVAKWVLRKSDKLRKILGKRSRVELILGYTDDINVMLLSIDSYIYVLQLDSLQFTKLWKTPKISRNHPYASIYGSGNSLLISLYNRTKAIAHSTWLLKFLYRATEMLG